MEADVSNKMITIKVSENKFISANVQNNAKYAKIVKIQVERWQGRCGNLWSPIVAKELLRTSALLRRRTSLQVAELGDAPQL